MICTPFTGHPVKGVFLCVTVTNPETKDNAETWDVAGLIQRKRSEKEMENAYLRKPYDTLQVYNSALNMCFRLFHFFMES